MNALVKVYRGKRELGRGEPLWQKVLDTHYRLGAGHDITKATTKSLMKL